MERCTTRTSIDPSDIFPQSSITEVLSGKLKALFVKKYKTKNYSELSVPRTLGKYSFWAPFVVYRVEALAKVTNLGQYLQA